MTKTFHELRKTLNGVGWFIPPYVRLDFLHRVGVALDGDDPSNQMRLSAFLAVAYSPTHLAAMVCSRYAETPYVRDYRDIIAEAVEAHFFGLGHVAFSGLAPVIEGVAKKLTLSRSMEVAGLGMGTIISNLAMDCKAEVSDRRIGSEDELITMIDSFVVFAQSYFYVNSSSYPLDDNTNRHGPLHGSYSDDDYGDAVNFYKVISAVDFLCMIAAFRARVSWLAPTPTPESQKLAAFYIAAHGLRGACPR